MLLSLISTAACRVRAWESRASSAARSTICSATWLSCRFSGRHWGHRPGSITTTPRSKGYYQRYQPPGAQCASRHLGPPCRQYAKTGSESQELGEDYGFEPWPLDGNEAAVFTFRSELRKRLLFR